MLSNSIVKGHSSNANSCDDLHFHWLLDRNEKVCKQWLIQAGKVDYWPCDGSSHDLFSIGFTENYGTAMKFTIPLHEFLYEKLIMLIIYMYSSLRENF